MLVAGRGAAMAGRSGKLYCRQRQGPARGQRPRPRLWRSGGCGEQRRGSEESAAQGPEGLHADRQAAQAARYARQDQRQGHLRHRRDAARNEVRDRSPHVRSSAARSLMSTTARRRKFPACGRSSCSTIWSPSSAITCGPPRKASTRSSSPGTKARTRSSARTTSGRICAPRAKRTASSPSPGDIAKGLSQGDRLEAAYELPFLAHATMEPMNCTVHLTPGACEIWTGTQVMTRVQSTAAKAAGLPVDKVTVHNHLIGGGFGRRLEADMVASAVRIAQHVDGPVEGGVDPRRRHPARCLSSGLSRRDFREPVGRQDRRLEISRHRLVGHGALVSGRLPERRRHRRGR